MIRLIGAEETREHEAALALQELIVNRWPTMQDSSEHEICIVAGAKCHGQRRRDIDILLLATFAPGVAFSPYLPIRVAGGQLLRVPLVDISSLCLAIEVKDHDAEDVRFVGTDVYVKYGDLYHNASEQNEEQIYSVKNYLEGQGIRAPFVTGLVWLRNVPNTNLPPRPHGIIASPVTWETILNVVAQLMAPRWNDGAWILTAGERDRVTVRRAAELFTKVITPTRLDRQRVERITQRSVPLALISDSIGRKLVIIRGRSGSGKTMYLLQLANRLAEEQDARVLILTYNKALVADIRRLLSILGIGDDVVGRTIQIQTVHSFLYGAFRALGVTDDSSASFLQDYENLKEEALEFFRSGALAGSDLASLETKDSEAFRWDYVFVDEGQDWPPNERDLLVRMYGAGHIVVADGVDQLVRSTSPVDWRSGDVDNAMTRVIPLRVTLRMKTGLARFASAVARQLGLLTAEWEPAAEMPGGKVVIVDGSYLSSRALHDRLVRQNAEDGNEPVDMLFCIPPGLVTRDTTGSARSVVADTFSEWGLETWDGASVDVRESYPTDIKQLRIVQYESCRGLEGWTVVNMALDDFYEYKTATFSPEPWSDSPTSLGDAAQLHAARWTMIPLTRAIDTLVIQITKPYSHLRTALVAAASECRDYVEWLTLN